MFLKVKAKETKGETRTISFQTAVSLICTLFNCKSYAHFHMHVFSKSHYLYVSVPFAFVYDTTCMPVPPCEVIKSIVWLAHVPGFLHLSASFLV